MNGTNQNVAAASNPLRVFISYPHKDDDFRAKLVTALIQLQRDRLIEQMKILKRAQLERAAYKAGNLVLGCCTPTQLIMQFAVARAQGFRQLQPRLSRA